MYDDWVQRSAGLPLDGERIEFLLDGRRVAMHGTYMLSAFHSHWAQYGVDRVRSWRKRIEAIDLAPPARNQPVSDLSSTSPHETSHQPLLAGGIVHAA